MKHINEMPSFATLSSESLTQQFPQTKTRSY